MSYLTPEQWVRHPIIVVDSLKIMYDIELFTMHFYRYAGMSGIGRDFVEHDELWSACRVRPDTLDIRMQKLGDAIPALSMPAEDMSLSSLVITATDRARWHIPQVDFAIQQPDKNVFDAVALAAQKLTGRAVKLYIFHSGNSYHGYVDYLISQHEWYQWMSKLLLISPAHAVPSIDVRWIGHQIRNGQSSLRWSYGNRLRYTGIPQLFDWEALP